MRKQLSSWPSEVTNLALFVNTWKVKFFLHGAASWLLNLSARMVRVVLCRGIAAPADTSRPPSPGSQVHTSLWQRANVAHGPLWSAAGGWSAAVLASWKSPAEALQLSHLPSESLRLLTRAAAVSCRQVKPALLT